METAKAVKRMEEAPRPNMRQAIHQEKPFTELQNGVRIKEAMWPGPRGRVSEKKGKREGCKM